MVVMAAEEMIQLAETVMMITMAALKDLDKIQEPDTTSPKRKLKKLLFPANNPPKRLPSPNLPCPPAHLPIFWMPMMTFSMHHLNKLAQPPQTFSILAGPRLQVVTMISLIPETHRRPLRQFRDIPSCPLHLQLSQVRVSRVLPICSSTALRRFGRFHRIYEFQQTNNRCYSVAHGTHHLAVNPHHNLYAATWQLSTQVCRWLWPCADFYFTSAGPLEQKEPL